MLVVALAGVTTAAASPSSIQTSDERYTALANAHFARQFRAQPVTATEAGVHDYDGELGSYGAVDYAAQLASDRRELAQLVTIDPSTMTARGGLDRRMLEMSLRDDLLLNGRMAQWRHQPDGYVQTASNAIFLLISRNFAPAAVRLDSAIAREEQLPRLFAQARANLTAVDRDTAQIALDDADGAVTLFAATVPSVFAGVGDAPQQRRFRHATRTAVAATKAFETYLHRWIAHPAGTYAIGAANYRDRLAYEEGIHMPLAAYLAVGTAALAQTHAQIVALAHRIDPQASTETVLQRVYRIHPSPQALLPAAAADLVRLRAFLVARRIIDLPSDADITVTPTPEFERATTTASMDAPGPLETVATRAYYNVTPADPRDPPAVREQYLQAFNDFERPIISAHEVYPGHYTNFIIDKHLPLTLSEKMLTATSFVEGWAHYDEQMVVDQGWGNGDPRVRLMQLREAIWRNARYVAGVKLHTQGMTVAQATRFFQTEAFLDPASARAEARRGTQDATYGYYTLGKLMILKLRDDYHRKLGRAYTLAKFHAALLQYGDPAIPLLRPLLLGADDDGKVLPSP